LEKPCEDFAGLDLLMASNQNIRTEADIYQAVTEIYSDVMSETKNSLFRLTCRPPM
jgi:hypothetical protein